MEDKNFNIINKELREIVKDNSVIDYMKGEDINEVFDSDKEIK